jgi:hypothetical protein
LAGEIQAIVHSVDEIDIGEAWRPEEHGIARCLANEGVGCWIGEAKVGFYFYDPSREPLSV